MNALVERIECSTKLRLIVAIVAGLLGGFVIERGLSALETDDRSPARFVSAEALNSPVEAGGLLRVRLAIETGRDDCRVRSSRYVTDRDGKVHELSDETWAGMRAGAAPRDQPYDVSALPPGQYTLHVQLTYYCDGGRQVFPLEQPPVSFRVAPGAP